jgi:hypothetical protein
MTAIDFPFNLVQAAFPLPDLGSNGTCTPFLLLQFLADTLGVFTVIFDIVFQ